MTTTPKRRVLTRLPSISEVEAYLKGQGWIKATPGTNRNILIYRGYKDIYGNPLTLGLPARPDLLDAKERIAAAVRTLATIEAKTPRAMAMKIITSNGMRTARLVPKPTKIARQPDGLPIKIGK